MADYCRQCSIELFGTDTRDMADRVTQEEWDKGYAADALCEGCGFVQVDPEGRCILPKTPADAPLLAGCIKDHGGTK